MDLYEELVRGPGYAVCPIENMRLFKKLRDSFLDKINISTESKKNINTARSAIVKMSLAEINSSRINLLTFTNLSDMIINSCPSLVETLCGKELFIQRRAHIIFNVPDKELLRIWNHYEMISGISPFTYVLWAPLHDLDDDGGAYIIDQKESLEVMKKEEAEGLVNGPTVLNMMEKQKPARLKFGQLVVFNPFVLHGNVQFNSKFARIACNVRFQSYHKPLLQKNSDYLKYYRLP
jgi:sporadic carbohydrate cluster 2OG-Fe(II) oxygenase|tara:strand:- start:2694 stop:3398 length:705 start_codon:yes stop_codon:yes gene_type:complete